MSHKILVTKDGISLDLNKIDTGCENFLNPEFKNVRNALYNYHLKGLDLFYSSPEESRKLF